MRPILEINLSAIAHNYQLCKKTAPNSEIGAVVKANAYGLGSIQISKKLSQNGCRTFFTVYYAEALELIEHLPTTSRVIVFHGFEDKIHPQIIPVINTINAIPNNTPYWLHIDTGMNRLGIPYQDFKTSYVQKNCLGMMSHFACSDEPDHPFTAEQNTRFQDLSTKTPSIKKSLSASSGLFRDPKFHYDLARPGICLYGGNPTPERKNPMQPVINLKAKLLQKMILKKDETVGYGCTYKAPSDMQVGTIAHGYADGLFRYLSNKQTSIKILGIISMDLCVVDLSHLNETEFDHISEVEIINNSYIIDDIARDAGTIPYEILTNLGYRFERVYLDHGI